MRPTAVHKSESAILSLIRLAKAGANMVLGRPQAQKVAARGVAAKSTAVKRSLTMAGLWRQAGWGLAAVAALFVAVLSTRDDAAMERVGRLLASLNLVSPPPARRQFDAEAAARQLAQAVRGLVDDRDRLATRLAALEHDMGDMTGSIKSQIEAVKAAKSEPPPWPDEAPPVTMTPADIAAMIKTVTPAPVPAAAAPAPSPPVAAAIPSPSSQQAAVAAAAPAEAPAPAGTAYGADVGTAASIKALHARWTWLRTAHPALFEGLQPLVSLKQNPHTNRTELHLIVGPYANADAADQFCDFIVPFHLTCQPAMFDGSRLALQ
jgi:hypothetical protein